MRALAAAFVLLLATFVPATLAATCAGDAACAGDATTGDCSQPGATQTDTTGANATASGASAQAGGFQRCDAKGTTDGVSLGAREGGFVASLTLENGANGCRLVFVHELNSPSAPQQWSCAPAEVPNPGWGHVLP